MRAFVCLVVAFAVLPGVVSAEPPGVTWPGLPPGAAVVEGVVDTVRVVADRLEREEALRRLPLFATVHEVAGVERTRVESVAEIIEDGVGVRVRRYGGLGAYSAASIRGSSASQVEVFLDGVPLRSAQWGGANLSDLPLSGLSRIEVFRGPAPPEFSSPGIGGVVNLVTLAPERVSPGIACSFGSHGTCRIDVTAPGRFFGAPVSLSLRRLDSRGDFAYLNDNGTPENPLDDAIVARGNNDFARTGVLLRASPRLPGGWRCDLLEDLLVNSGGVPGVGNVPIESARADLSRSVTRLSVAPPRLMDGSLDLRASGFAVVARDRFRNPDDETGLPRADTIGRATSVGLQTVGALSWIDSWQLISLVAEVRRERYVPESADPRIGEGFTRERWLATLGVEDRFALPDGRLSLVGGCRYQASSDNYTGPEPIGGPPMPLETPHRASFLSPSVGVAWRVREGITLKATAARHARFPTMLEAFGARGSVAGNSDLEPEEGTTFDLGAVASVAGGVLEAGVFRSDRGNLIVFLENSQRTVKAWNLESARVEGVEFSFVRRRDRGLSVAASYTREDARNTGPSPVYHGKRLPYCPEHSLFVGTSFAAGPLLLAHEFHYESASWLDRANLPENRIAPRRIHSLLARLELGAGGAALSVEVANLTDAAIIDVEGYPLPGRSWHVGLEIVPGARTPEGGQK